MSSNSRGVLVTSLVQVGGAICLLARIEFPAEGDRDGRTHCVEFEIGLSDRLKKKKKKAFTLRRTRRGILTS